MTGPRERLDDRRGHWLYRFQSGGHDFTGGVGRGGHDFTGGVGRFPDGRLAEVFITGTKVGTAAETNAQDAAIVASLALQHGCPVDTIRHSLARRSVGGDGPLAALLNEVARDEAAAQDEREKS